MTPEELREYDAEEYFTTENELSGETLLLRLLDWPTDGPLFEIVGIESEDLDDYGSRIPVQVQYDASEHDSYDFTHVDVREEGDFFEVETEMSETDHVWTFDWFGGEAWPEYMEQGGESYRVGLDDIPEFVLCAIEDKFDVEVVER